MRDKAVTKKFYLQQLGFQQFGDHDYEGYLMVFQDAIQVHFFEFKELKPAENCGQIYIRTNDIDALYKSLLQNEVVIHPNGQLADKPWGQREFSILDPDNNLLTFGQELT